jgi:hypothetical protein
MLHGAEVCKGSGVEHLKKRNCLEDLDVKIVLRWTLQELDGRHESDSTGSSSGQVVDPFNMVMILWVL